MAKKIATSFTGYPRDTLKFLSELEQNNNREWFQCNKARYESSVLEPSIELIRTLIEPIGKVAPMLTVEPKRVGGSLMRIYKDTRFSKDKTPYKTNIGIQFRHAAGKDVHAPGVYLHVAPDECFFGAGIWQAPSDALRKIRHYIVENETTWKRAFHNKKMRNQFEFYEDRLRTAPRGYAKDHPQIDDLRLKSFLVTSKLQKSQIQSKELAQLIPNLVKQANPLMEILCTALAQPY